MILRHDLAAALVGAALLVACGGDPAPDAGVDAGHDAGVDAGAPDAGFDAGPEPDVTVTACEEVVIEGAAGAVVDGWPLVATEDRGADLAFVAPGVARPTFLFVGDTVVRVDPRDEAFAIPGLASACGPFTDGVASGDPRPDGVTLWTRWSEATLPATLSFQVASDPSLATVVASGSVEATADADGTVHVDVGGLAPATTYYYRFTGPGGEPSAIGRTRTAGDRERLRVAVASCSSLFSGWFNAYRRIAERDDLDLVIHLGDYIYDFVDEDEPVRVPPSGEVEEPSDLAGHRRRHREYLADPDLRLARQMHPWLALWDNHDLERDAPARGGGVQAFREYLPIQPPPTGASPDVLYRALRYGDLADVLIVDMYLFQRQDTLPGGEPSALGAAQWTWLTGELAASRAAWRVLGMQKVFGEMGPFSGWTDFDAERSRLIGHLAAEGVVDVVFLSGDSHFTIFQDVVDHPTDEARPYDPATGAGAVGAELLATSISRGNFDEQLGAGSLPVIERLRAGFLRDNPHQVDLELVSHGYGVVDVTRERVEAQVFYSPILGPADTETPGPIHTVARGANRWTR